MKVDAGGEKWPMDLGRQLLQMRCIYGVPLTQEDMAPWWGVSRQRIDQIEHMALRKLRFRMNRETWEELREFFFR